MPFFFLTGAPARGFSTIAAPAALTRLRPLIQSGCSGSKNRNPAGRVLKEMLSSHPALEVLLPAHNEAETIEATLREIYEELSPRLPLRFIVCEDGSVDNTKQVLTRLSQALPMKLIMSEERKGYSRAVIDGMKALEAPYLVCLDSDGQCDPRDFWKFWEARESGDVLVGWRIRRRNNLMRKTMSRAFYVAYRLLYGVPVHDPSCPYVLARKQVIEKLVSDLGTMKQGFWWEFMARAHRRGFSVMELAVNHRERSVGTTRIYKLGKLPGIAYRHVVALFKIWLETRSKL